jgi:Uma2 family endonuclease
MQSQTQKRTYTPEEYLELEEKADYKNEYCDGKIVLMTGGTINHNKIAGNFYARLNLALSDEDYDVYIGDVKLWIPKYRQFTYPDVMVVRGRPICYGSNTTTVMNPLLIVEVLSKSTKNYDLGDKFIYYRSIPEFQEYILIDQTKCHAMQYAKNPDGKWLLSEQESEEAVFELSSVEFQVNLKDIYKKVDFAESEE